MSTSELQENDRSRLSGYGVLCGTDFSESAQHAVRAAAAIAKRIEQPLIMVHAIEMPKLGRSHAQFLKCLTTSRRNDLRHEAEEVRKAGVEVKEYVQAGHADEVLVNVARTKRARMLVVGSVGHRGLDRWLFGSVSERAAERAPTPTLVVRNARPLVAWARGKHPLKVFACFNDTLTSEAALSWVKELFAVGPCEITIGWVNWPAEQWRRLGGHVPFSPTHNPPDVQQALERNLKVKAEQLLGGVPLRIRVEANWGRPDDCLTEMAREEGAHLIVTGSHQYRGFERLWHSSVSRGLLCRAVMSVAVVPYVSGKSRPASLPPPLRRVLVATDFSELANAAIPRAYSLLRGGGTVHLLHVMPYAGKLSTARCVANLRMLAPVEAEAQGILTRVEVAKGGDVARLICQNAERLGAEVICLGSHGRSGLSKLLMGSIAQNVLARSRQPLLIVRPPVT